MDRLTRTVREQVALGRLLPLGGPDDAVWITERAVVRALRRACAALPGVRLGDVGVGLGEGDVEGTGPRGRCPRRRRWGPCRTCRCGSRRTSRRRRTSRCRSWPTGCGTRWGPRPDGLGLVVEGVDLHVTGLLEADAPATFAVEDELADGEPDLGPAIVQGTAEAVGAAARAVPGVLRLTRRLAGLGGGVRIRDTEPPEEPARLRSAPDRHGGGARAFGCGPGGGLRGRPRGSGGGARTRPHHGRRHRRPQPPRLGRPPPRLRRLRVRGALTQGAAGLPGAWVPRAGRRRRPAGGAPGPQAQPRGGIRTTGRWPVAAQSPRPIGAYPQGAPAPGCPRAGRRPVFQGGEELRDKPTHRGAPGPAGPAPCGGNPDHRPVAGCPRSSPRPWYGALVREGTLGP